MRNSHAIGLAHLRDEETEAGTSPLLPWDEASGESEPMSRQATAILAVFAGPHIPLHPGPPTGLLARALGGEALSADEVAAAIRQAIEEDRRPAAERLLVLAARRGIASRSVESWRSVLAPGRAWIGGPGRPDDHGPDWEWLESHRLEYCDCFLAVGRGQLVAAARTVPDLHAELTRLRGQGDAGFPTLLVKIDTEGRVC